jgi:hypothetical protein
MRKEHHVDQSLQLFVRERHDLCALLASLSVSA